VAKATTDHVEAALLDGRRGAVLQIDWPDDQGAVQGVASDGSGARCRRRRWRAGSAAAYRAAQDRSATIGLPDGWKLVPQMSQMGSVVAGGPNGESAEMGLPSMRWTPAIQRCSRRCVQVQNGGLRGTAYATASYIPYNAELPKTFEYQIQKMRKQAGLQPAVYAFWSVTPMGQGSQGRGQRCAQFQGTVDFQDGKGKREMNTLYCAYAPNQLWPVVEHGVYDDGADAVGGEGAGDAGSDSGEFSGGYGGGAEAGECDCQAGD
jgi:hypothetical protein